jgi:hypothetical protein
MGKSRHLFSLSWRITVEMMRGCTWQKVSSCASEIKLNPTRTHKAKLLLAAIRGHSRRPLTFASVAVPEAAFAS